MKKIPKFILIFLILFVFANVLSFLYFWKIQEIEMMWMPYHMIRQFLVFLPLIASISILWSLVFKEKTEAVKPKSGAVLFFFFYTFFAFVIAFGLSEFLMSFTYQKVMQKNLLNQYEVTEAPEIESGSDDIISKDQFDNLKYYLHKDDVSFAMETVMVYMEELYNVKGNYFIKGLQIIAYATNQKIEYIISAEYAREYENALYILDPVYYEYSRGKLDTKTTIQGVKTVRLIYDIEGIYNTFPLQDIKDVNLLNIILYNDFVYLSKINLFRMSNITYNKLAYYVILILLIILSVSIGWSIQNIKIVKREIFQMICFYILSFIIVTAAYDILIKLSNMIYGLVV